MRALIYASLLVRMYVNSIGLSFVDSISVDRSIVDLVLIGRSVGGWVGGSVGRVDGCSVSGLIILIGRFGRSVGRWVGPSVLDDAS